jgi:GxxExxY protein
MERSPDGALSGQVIASAMDYKGVSLECGYRLDIVVDEQLIIEVKSVDRLMPIHDAQMLTYLRLSGLRLGLLMNFNSLLLKEGLRRLVL